MPVVRITRSDLHALARKYRALAELRRSAELEAGAELSGLLLGLGREFPGALIELDRLPLPEIDRRLEAIEQGLVTGAVEPWIVWMCAYHQSMRAALELRRRVSGRAELARALARELASAAERATGFPCDAELVIAVARARGGVEVVVLERLSRQMGVPAAEIRRALFPEPRAGSVGWARI
jgi:hypothetical protein